MKFSGGCDITTQDSHTQEGKKKKNLQYSLS